MGSPALAPPDVRDVTLSLFAGRKTDIAPSDLPEGLTPDEQDGIYVPGEWLSRPALSRLYQAGVLSPGTTVLYEKTYVQPNNDPLTLLLTSDGKLWAEDLGNNPGNPATISQLGDVGLYAQSVTEFGREYIAFSDLLHGQGIPLQFDGTNLDRVTMDGPGVGPSITDLQTYIAITSTGLDTAATGFLMPINAATEAGNICTLDFVSGHKYIPGQSIVVTGCVVAGYNGTFEIASITTSSISYFNDATGLSTAGSGGLVNIAVAECTTSAPHGLSNGDYFVIAGATVPSGAFNPNNTEPANTFSGTVDTDTTGFIVSVASGDDFTEALNGQNITINGIIATVATVTSPTSLTLTGQVTASQSGVAYSASVNNPANWQVVKVIDDLNFLFSVADSTQVLTSDSNATGGHINSGGQSAPGIHQVVCMWLSRQGALSAPSPPIPFQSIGNTQWEASDLPIGPANVVARVLGFTGAGGDNFFIIPASVTIPNSTGLLGAPIVVGATVVPDNTSTSFTFDVSDNSLFAAVPIDQIGNDLFDQVVLGPVLGFFAFASRLACWGDYNKIENFLSNGFESGHVSGAPTIPLAWSVVTAGGSLATGGSWTSGGCWVISTDNTGSPNGQISQPAYQDAFGDAILSPSTQYAFRIWVKINQDGSAGEANVVAEFYSPSAGSLATATIPVPTTPAYGSGLISPLIAFSAKTPAVIPADTLLRLSANSTGFFSAPVLELDDWEVVFSEDPYRDNESRWSYVENPEAFAQSTGNLGPEDDESPIRCFALLRSSSLLETAEGVHIFTDSTAEPDDWNVNQVTRAVGGASVRSGDPGKFGTGDAAEDWALVAGKNGVYLFAGAEFWKVSQEISRGSLPQAQDPRLTWDDINWAAQQTIVAKNDPALRRAYFAVPVNGALTPNKIAVLDYREMDTATQIAGAPPLHITIQGKMKSSDLTRKWSWWNVAANDMEILVRPGNQRQLFLAGGNGQAVGAGVGFGNIYSLDPANLTDDDYGAIAPYYTTYFFTDHDQEQALGIGSDIHLVRRIHAFITGVGLVTITPIVNSLYNFQPNLSQRILVGDTDASNFLASDLEWTTVGLRGNRIAFRIGVQPLPGTTDVQIRLQKFIVAMMKDPIVQFRQSGV